MGNNESLWPFPGRELMLNERRLSAHCTSGRLFGLGLLFPFAQILPKNSAGNWLCSLLSSCLALRICYTAPFAWGNLQKTREYWDLRSPADRRMGRNHLCDASLPCVFAVKIRADVVAMDRNWHKMFIFSSKQRSSLHRLPQCSRPWKAGENCQRCAREAVFTVFGAVRSYAFGRSLTLKSSFSTLIPGLTQHPSPRTGGMSIGSYHHLGTRIMSQWACPTGRPQEIPQGCQEWKWKVLFEIRIKSSAVLEMTSNSILDALKYRCCCLICGQNLSPSIKFGWEAEKEIEPLNNHLKIGCWYSDGTSHLMLAEWKSCKFGFISGQFGSISRPLYFLKSISVWQQKQLEGLHGQLRSKCFLLLSVHLWNKVTLSTFPFFSHTGNNVQNS